VTDARSCIGTESRSGPLKWKELLQRDAGLAMVVSKGTADRKLTAGKNHPCATLLLYPCFLSLPFHGLHSGFSLAKDGS